MASVVPVSLKMVSFLPNKSSSCLPVAFIVHIRVCVCVFVSDVKRYKVRADVVHLNFTA